MKSWEQKLVKTEQGELKAFDPITKELSDVGSGGSSGGGGNFIVHLNYVFDNTQQPPLLTDLVLDKHYSDIYNAYISGQNVLISDISPDDESFYSVGYPVYAFANPGAEKYLYVLRYKVGEGIVVDKFLEYESGDYPYPTCSLVD